MAHVLASKLLFVLTQVCSCVPQTCEHNVISEQTQLGLAAVVVTVECYDSGYVGVSWSASVEVNTLTLKYLCSSSEGPTTSVQGVLLQSSNELVGHRMLPEGPFQGGVTCSTWGCFEWDNPLLMYPDVGVGNISCTTRPFGCENCEQPNASASMSYQPATVTGTTPSLFTLPASEFPDAMQRRLMMIVTVILSTCSFVVIASLSITLLFICRSRMKSVLPSLPKENNSIIKVDTTVATDVESVHSDSVSFSPLDYSTIQPASKPSGSDPAVLCLEPRSTCPELTDEFSSVEEVASCSEYVMVRAFHSGYINSDVNARGSGHHEIVMTPHTSGSGYRETVVTQYMSGPGHHEKVTTENIYL